MYTQLKERVSRWVNSYIKPQFVGMDISDRSVKYLKFRERRLISIDSFGTIDIPAGIIEAGEIKNEAELVKIMKATNESGRLHAYFVAAALPEEKSFVRLIQIPKVTIDEVGNAIRWELEANVPVPAEEIYYDYEIVEPLQDHLDHLDIVITASPKVIVESYIRVLKQAGLLPFVVELESQAIVRSVIPVLRDKASRIIVDMGRYRTSFIIYSGGSITFTNTVELGGYLIEESLAKSLVVDAQKSVELKKKFGLNKKELDGKIFTSLLPVISSLSDGLKKTVQYYEAHNTHSHGSSSTISEILFVGGEASLFGLDTYLSSTLKIPVRAASPFVSLEGRLDPSIPIIPKNLSFAYATAVGLALKGIR